MRAVLGEGLGGVPRTGEPDVHRQRPGDRRRVSWRCPRHRRGAACRRSADLVVEAENSHTAVARADEAHRRGDALVEARAGRRRSRHRPHASRRTRLRRRGARTEGGAIHRVILLPGGIALRPRPTVRLSKRSVTGSRRSPELSSCTPAMSRRSTTASVTRWRHARDADARGWDRFHLVGYSAGGATARDGATSRPIC